MKRKITLKEAYKELFGLEEKIEFLQYFIGKKIGEENLSQADIDKLEENIFELDRLVNERNMLYIKLEAFKDVYIEL